MTNEIDSAVALKHVPYYNKARLSIETKQYKDAIPYLDSLLIYYPNNASANFLAGICYAFKEDLKKKALYYFNNCSSIKHNLPDYNYWCGLAYEVNDSLKKAKEVYTNYLENNTTDKEPLYAQDVKRRMENIKMAQSMKRFENMVTIKNIGSPINTEASEYVPLVPSDESFMVYTYRGKLSKGGKQTVSNSILINVTKKEEGIYFEDVFIATKKNDSTWNEPSPIKSINTSLHDAAVTLSSDGTMLFIYKNLGSGNGDLYLSKLNGNLWQVPVYQKGLNSDKWDGSEAFFPDNKRIIFSSERKGGQGGKDLYTAELIADNTWGNIANLGDQLNSSDDEDAPFITADGKTLFFASNGKISIGGYDILRSDLTENGWSKPYNIGKSVNTTNDDKFYIVSGDGKRGYYSSYKEGGKGEQDIYCIEPGLIGKPLALVQVAGNVTYNEKPVAASIMVKAIDMKNYKPQTYVSNSANGKFLLNLPSRNNFELTFNYKSLPPQKKMISTMKVDSFVQLNVIADFYSPDYLKYLNRKKDSIEKINNLVNALVDPDNFKKNYGDLVVNGLFYKVQIGAYRFIENFNYSNTCHLGKIIRKTYKDGITRFTIGNYKTFNEALQSLNLIKSDAIKDAFIIAIYNDEYYYLNDLLKKGVIGK
ncbi:MAG: hypothetical protein ACK50A_07405 [Sphingobacteriaceae bacterium]